MINNLIAEMSRSVFDVLEAEHRVRKLQRQLNAARIMIKALTKRLAEMEFKAENSIGGADKTDGKRLLRSRVPG